MLQVDAILLPKELQPVQVLGKAVVVFDVLRATTTMTAALAEGVSEIWVFPDLESAVTAAAVCPAPHLLCGESHAAKPPGFDLGNSPGAFSRDLHGGKIVFMSTTNGTRAIISASGAAAIFIGALVNADAVADAVASTKLDVTLLCSGTEGYVSSEDLLGAGAVIESLSARQDVELVSDTAWLARQIFRCEADRLQSALTASRGGHNIIRAGLSPDIGFAARLNSMKVVGAVKGHPPVVKLWNSTA